MLKKTLFAMAITGLLGCSAGALAGSGSTQSYNGINNLPQSMAGVLGAEAVSAPVELGDGILAWVVDDEFEGAQAPNVETAVGTTAGTGGSGSLSFASDGRFGSSNIGSETHNALAEEVYIVPAPLAYNNGVRHWRVELTPSNVAELNRLATENVYVMKPIEDSIVDPHTALTSGPDAFAAAVEAD